MSHTQIKMPIFKYYKEEKILHKPRNQSLNYRGLLKDESFREMYNL